MATKKDPQAAAFQQAMDEYKLQAAKKAGLDTKIKSVGWKNMSAAECGKIGGLMGGKIGGQMIKKMLAMVKQAADQQQNEDCASIKEG